MDRLSLVLGVAVAACSSGGDAARSEPGACTQARPCVVRTRVLPAARGDIRDRRGLVMATSRKSDDLELIPALLDDQARTALIALLDLRPDEVAQLDARLARARDRNRSLVVLHGLSTDRVARIAGAAPPPGGAAVRRRWTRSYPLGALAGHLLGYMTRATDADLDDPGGALEPGDLVGRAGLEQVWDAYLRGKNGAARFAVDADGRRVADRAARRARLLPDPATVEALGGHDLVLTLDSALQRIVERAVPADAAAGVAVVEVDSGRVLALVSRPAIDPGQLSGSLTRDDLAGLQADPRRPFIDKTVTPYPPGATFGFVPAIGALDDHLAEPSDRLPCTGSLERAGHRFRCTARHGRLDLAGAVQRGCSAHLWQLAEQVGLDRMAEVAADVGLGELTGLGLTGERAGRIPTVAWYRQRGTFSLASTLGAAIGQGDVEVTVVQLAMAYAALATGTRRDELRLVERVTDRTGRTVVAFDPAAAGPPIAPPQVLDVIRRGMWQAVNRPGGTAYPGARSTLVEIAGTAATAEVRPRRRRAPDPADPPRPADPPGWDPSRPHAWFAGWAPADHPEIAVVVLIEHGGDGGAVAAPVARAIVDGWWTEVRR